jgi:hypothetical protein
LPYVVRFTVYVVEIDAGSAARAVITGDIKGTARLTIEARGEGSSRARLVSSLVPVNPLLRSAAVLARPAVGWGHDWVLDHGRAQFVRHTSR